MKPSFAEEFEAAQKNAAYETEHPHHRQPSRTCPVCGREIREGQGRRGQNFKKHMATHEKKGAS